MIQLCLQTLVGDSAPASFLQQVPMSLDWLEMCVVTFVCLVTLMNFDQILMNFGKTLTIYVKFHQIHVNKNQEMSFSQNKKSNVKNHPEIGC